MIFLNGNIHQKGFVWISKPLQDLVVESKAKGAEVVELVSARAVQDRGRQGTEPC